MLFGALVRFVQATPSNCQNTFWRIIKDLALTSICHSKINAYDQVGEVFLNLRHLGSGAFEAIRTWMRGTKKIPCKRLSRSSILAFQLNRLDQETTACIHRRTFSALPSLKKPRAHFVPSSKNKKSTSFSASIHYDQPLCQVRGNMGKRNSICSPTRLVSKFNIEASGGWARTLSHLHLIIRSFVLLRALKMTSHWDLALPYSPLSVTVKGQRRAKISILHFYSKINCSLAHIQT